MVLKLLLLLEMIVKSLISKGETCFDRSAFCDLVVRDKTALSRDLTLIDSFPSDQQDLCGRSP